MSLTVKRQTDAYLLCLQCHGFLLNVPRYRCRVVQQMQTHSRTHLFLQTGNLVESLVRSDHAHRKTGRNYNFLETQLQFFPGFLFDGKFLPEKWKTVGLSRSLSGTHKRLVKDWRRLGRIPQSFEHFCQVQTEATTGKLNHASAGSGVPQSTRVNSRLLKPSRALSGGHAKRAGK